MTSTVPSLLELSVKAVERKRLRDVENLYDEHQEELDDIANTKLRKCRNSQEYEQLQRAKTELTRATASYNKFEAETMEERTKLENDAKDHYVEKKKQLLATHDSDALSALMALQQQIDGSILPRTCIHCRQTFSTPSMPPCSTIKPDGVDCVNAGPGVQTCGCRIQRCKICDKPSCSDCQGRHMYLCRLRCGFHRDHIFHLPYQVLNDGTVIEESKRKGIILPKAYCHDLPKSGYIENPEKRWSSNKIQMVDHYGEPYSDRENYCPLSDCSETFCEECYETHKKILLEQCHCGRLRKFLDHRISGMYECSCDHSCDACPTWAEEKGAILRASRPDFKTQQLDYYRYDPEITPDSRLRHGLNEGMYEIPSNPHRSRPDPKAFFD